MPDTKTNVVLRRPGMLILAWVLLVGLGIVLPFAGFSVTMTHEFRQGWQGVPVYLGLAGALGRGANIKVILREETLTVVNYLRTYNIPANAIRDVEVDNNGNLRIYLNKELRLRILGRISNVYVTAFAGPLMDHFRGTSGKSKADHPRVSLARPHSRRRTRGCAGVLDVVQVR
ncbi:hypothetical protein OG873_16255 [Streptomyces violaceus]|uniref:hypothetical protein n=1 Tax=Streptomyces violaceus TaxID=1936 RepID=UPI002E2CD19C|nr:hypothetical protein [Streptomyces violaceus]